MGIEVTVSHFPVVNFSMQQNNVPIIREIVLKNNGENDLPDITVDISFDPDFVEPVELHIDKIPAGGEAHLTAIPMKISTTFFSNLTERIAGFIKVAVTSDDFPIYSESFKLSLLAFDQWSGSDILPEMLAAFVTPNHPDLVPIVKRASEILAGWTGNPCLDGYQTRDPNRVKKQMAAVYEAIAERNITYCGSPASFEGLGQRIRMCDDLLFNKLGTCVDMTLLYASCLEAIGIHPLIVLTEKHAFAGGWLIEETFPDSVNDDPSLLTKRMADGINEIMLVETNCMHAGIHIEFDQACEAALERMRDSSKFEMVIDVQRARYGRVRPLPLRVVRNGAYEIIEDSPAEERAADDPAQLRNTEIVKSVDHIDVSKQTIWERKLLDLSLRNQLLNTRMTKSTLQLMTVNIGELEDALADGNEFQILPRPTDWENPVKNAGIYEAIHAQNPMVGLISDELRQKRLRSYLDEGDLYNTVTHLYRSSRVSLEENGANTLYLGIGLLKWFETEVSTRPRFAPIILMPIEILRKSAVKGYVIRSRDEEPMLNVTMMEMLRQDFGITVGGLDPLPHDEKGVDVARILNVIRRVVMQHSGWDVEEQAIIGNFSFNKFIMWNDIHNNADKLSRNKIVSSLISGKMELPPPVEADEDINLDEKYKAQDIALPIGADASQLEAICSAVQGKSFILHGPPGTGKSQTITNIIANALYNGKKVLFVAEKMAALQVVQRRLEMIGLAPFCLELHSNKTKKSNILSQLKRTTEVVKVKSPEAFMQEAEQINELRRELNGYINSLHEKRGIGMSLYDCFAKYADVESVRGEVKFPVKLYASMDYEMMRQCENAVAEFESICKAVGRAYGHPYAGCHLERYSDELKEEIRSAAGELASRIGRYMQSLKDMFAMTGHAPVCNETNLRRIVRLANLLTGMETVLPELFAVRDWDDSFKRITEFVATGGKCRMLKDDVERKLGAAFLEEFSPESVGQWAGIRRLFAACDKVRHFDDVTPVDDLTRVIKLYPELTQRIEKCLESLGGSAIELTNSKQMTALIEVCKLVLELHEGMPPNLFDPRKPVLSDEELNIVVGHGVECDRIKGEILGNFMEGILDTDTDMVKHEWMINSTKWFMPRYLGKRKILKSLNRYALSALVTEETLDDLLKRIKDYQRESALVNEKSAELAELFGEAWNGGNPDWVALDKLSKYRMSLNIAIEAMTKSKVKANAVRTKIYRGVRTDVVAFHDGCEDDFEHLIALSEDAKEYYDRIRSTGLDVEDLLNRARIYHESISALRERGDDIEILGEYWKDVDSDWERLGKAIREMGDIVDLTTEIGGAKDGSEAPRMRLAEELRCGIRKFLESHGDNLMLVASDYEPIRDGYSKLSYKLESPNVAQYSEDFIGQMYDRVSGWCDNVDKLKDWTMYRRHCTMMNDMQLGALVEAFEAGAVASDEIARFYRKSFFKGYSEYILSQEPQLSEFHGMVFNDKVERFKKLNREFERLTREELFAKLSSSLPALQKEAAQSSEVGILQRNIRNGGRGTSIRRLFEQIPDLLTRICPCMLMSPISVAQYIDADETPFDLVIFDEASQMPTSEAVGAIARGRNVVVVGDPKQMPPTNFFSVNTFDEDNPDMEDLESILDDCLALSFPSKYLSWHYRSKHESLIAFSNSKYYDNKLMTFPSPDDLTTKVGWVHIEGVYDRGRSRQNRAEAEAIIEEIKQRLSDPRKAGQSIGVVTFNSNQQSLIEDLLNELFKEHPELEAIATECDEPIFIKNLENVQGDERDVILFSIGYGPDRDGKVTFNFGPLNRDGGWRRLNVAVSRARYEMKVFSTLTADQINLNRTSSDGIAGLKAFLEYAEMGRGSLNDVTRSGDVREEDELLKSIAGELTKRGYEVRLNVGCSAYRIDIGVVDPEQPDKYLLGILCDGYNNRSARTARDRIVTQVDALKSLGWNLYHLWAMEWWGNRRATMETLVNMIEDVRYGRVAEPVTEPEPVVEEPMVIAPKKPRKKQEDEDSVERPYVTASLRTEFVSPNDLVYGNYGDKVTDKIFDVVDTEAPICKGLLCKRVLNSFGITRPGTRLLLYMDKMLEQSGLQVTSRDSSNPTYWSSSQDPDAYGGYRPKSEREFAEIPPEEIAVAICKVVSDQGSLPEEPLMREVAHLFNCNRLSEVVVTSIGRGINDALERGRIVRVGDRIKMNSNALSMCEN